MSVQVPQMQPISHTGGDLGWGGGGLCCVGKGYVGNLKYTVYLKLNMQFLIVKLKPKKIKSLKTY